MGIFHIMIEAGKDNLTDTFRPSVLSLKELYCESALMGLALSGVLLYAYIYIVFEYIMVSHSHYDHLCTRRNRLLLLRRANNNNNNTTSSAPCMSRCL